MTYVVRASGGVQFEDGADTARLLISGDETNGRYSLLEWTVAANDGLPSVIDYGPHLHREAEEIFHIQEGALEFLIGDEVVTLSAGDLVRVPPGTKHGYRNISGHPVRMFVSFSPGGFESLFVKYRTDQGNPSGPGFVEEATLRFASEFGLANP